MSTLYSGPGEPEYGQKRAHKEPEVVTILLDSFPSGGETSPIQTHERGTSVFGVEAGAQVDVSPIIQSPFSFGNTTWHVTADVTQPR